ncbi:MAG: hypothetical protein Q9209_001895 [Squamulea sp. 1 TL-2023]
MSLCGQAAPNCTLWSEGKDDSKYQADPDIAGVGVISAFAVNSFVTIAIAVAGLLFGLVRGLEDNAIDRLVISQFQKVSFLQLKKKRFEFWQPIMESLVLALSDQQLLVGISILITGFIKHCSISVNHFTIVTDLAWFSSSTNMTALSVLQVYLLEHPPLRNWRVCLMLVIFVFLIVALVLQGHREWTNSWNSPAQCLFDGFLVNLGGEPAMWMTLQISALICNYSFSILGLFDSGKFDYLFFEKPVRRMERSIAKLQKKKETSISKEGWQSYTSSVLLLPAWVLVSIARKAYISLAAIVNSIAINLCLDIFFFVFGIWSIISDRNIPRSEMIGNENEWGFGQIVQVLLLASIILNFKDCYTKQSAKQLRHTKQSRQASSTGPPIQRQPQSDDATAEQSEDSEDSQSADVTLVKADIEAGGHGETTGNSPQDAPAGHSLVRRTATLTEVVTTAD